jgi:hypothetical protein
MENRNSPENGFPFTFIVAPEKIPDPAQPMDPEIARILAAHKSGPMNLMTQRTPPQPRQYYYNGRQRPRRLRISPFHAHGNHG